MGREWPWQVKGTILVVPEDEVSAETHSPRYQHTCGDIRLILASECKVGHVENEVSKQGPLNASGGRWLANDIGSKICRGCREFVSRYDTQSHLNANPEETKAGHVFNMNEGSRGLQQRERGGDIGAGRYLQEAKNGHPCAIASCGDGPREEMEVVVVVLLSRFRPSRRFAGGPHDAALGKVTYSGTCTRPNARPSRPQRWEVCAFSWPISASLARTSPRRSCLPRHNKHHIGNHGATSSSGDCRLHSTPTPDDLDPRPTTITTSDDDDDIDIPDSTLTAEGRPRRETPNNHRQPKPGIISRT